MRELGRTRFRIDLLRETPEQVKQLLDRFTRLIAGVDDGKTTWRELRALNQLGVTRGGGRSICFRQGVYGQVSVETLTWNRLESGPTCERWQW